MTVQLLDERVATHAGRVTDRPQLEPNPEVPERARRRTFTAKYKLEVLATYDAAPVGEKGAVLRREGLYSSHVTEWRRARDLGTQTALGQPRGPRRPDAREVELVRLRREKVALERELAKACFVVDVQAKLQALLEKLSAGADTEPRSTP